jgi:hypothetical protein
MQRVNQYNFYQLGINVHPLADIPNDSSVNDHLMTLFNADIWVNYLMQNSLIPISVARPACFELLNAIRAIVDINKFAAEDFEKKIEPHQLGTLKTALQKFEAVFSAELQAIDTYFISQKGIFSTGDLIERAQNFLPEEIRKYLPDSAKTDLQQAGRCLARLPLLGVENRKNSDHFFCKLLENKDRNFQKRL